MRVYRAFGSCTAARIHRAVSRTIIILHRHAKVLDDPWLDAWQKPQEVMSALARIRTNYVNCRITRFYEKVIKVKADVAAIHL